MFKIFVHGTGKKKSRKFTSWSYIQQNSAYYKKKHKKKNQDKVPTNLAKKWIEVNYSKIKVDFNFHSSIIRNVLFPPQQALDETKHLEQEENLSETKWYFIKHVQFI